MILVVGLGNPGDRYRDTRHNLGFMVVDLIAERWGRAVWRHKFQGETALADAPGGGDKVALLKPHTFMNLSGQSVQAATTFYKVTPPGVVVVHDELDVPFGQVKLKSGGGDAGHNGLKSVTAQLGTNGYQRVRVGIGRPPSEFRGDVADYVLRAFAPAEQADLAAVVARAADAVEMIVKSGISAAMNNMNRRPS